MSAPSAPRVAIGGIVLESNAFAPVATGDDFRSRYYFEGEQILAEAAKQHSALPKETAAFVRAMHATGPWTPVPTLLTGCQPSGPVEEGFFESCVQAIEESISANGPVDAVYLTLHGAMTASHELDPDGLLIERVRKAAGKDAVIIATLDLHANVSERMVEQSDLLIGYLTNPHIDMWLRGEEAAFSLRTVLATERPHAAVVRLPMVPSSISLLSGRGPYGEMINYAERRRRELSEEVLNVSVLGGFAFSDTPKNGLSVVVTARRDPAIARRLAREVATLGWRLRRFFLRDLTSLDEAITIAKEVAEDSSLPPVIFSDAGDNPGGGGGGNTTDLLKALHEAKMRDVLVGAFVDPALAAEAHEKGEGATFDAVFNREGSTEYAKRIELPATVRKLSDGELVGRLGIFRDRELQLGPSAALEIDGPDGIVAVVISNRQQAADPMFFEAFGLDIASARTVAVKSRGHFRAGFAPWFGPQQVYEVDTPGLTSPVLERHPWKHLPRPSFPLDFYAEWNPDD